MAIRNEDLKKENLEQIESDNQLFRLIYVASTNVGEFKFRKEQLPYLEFQAKYEIHWGDVSGYVINEWKTSTFTYPYFIERELLKRKRVFTKKVEDRVPFRSYFHEVKTEKRDRGLGFISVTTSFFQVYRNNDTQHLTFKRSGKDITENYIWDFDNKKYITIVPESNKKKKQVVKSGERIEENPQNVLIKEREETVKYLRERFSKMEDEIVDQTDKLYIDAEHSKIINYANESYYEQLRKMTNDAIELADSWKTKYLYVFLAFDLINFDEFKGMEIVCNSIKQRAEELRDLMLELLKENKIELTKDGKLKSGEPLDFLEYEFKKAYEEKLQKPRDVVARLFTIRKETISDYESAQGIQVTIDGYLGVYKGIPIPTFFETLRRSYRTDKTDKKEMSDELVQQYIVPKLNLIQEVPELER